MVSCVWNLLVKNTVLVKNSFTYWGSLSAKNPFGKRLWIVSDDVMSLASKRVMYLVCRRSHRSSSALMILWSSLLVHLSYGVVISDDTLHTSDFCTICEI